MAGEEGGEEVGPIKRSESAKRVLQQHPCHACAVSQPGLPKNVSGVFCQQQQRRPAQTSISCSQCMAPLLATGSQLSAFPPTLLLHIYIAQHPVMRRTRDGVSCSVAAGPSACLHLQIHGGGWCGLDCGAPPRSWPAVLPAPPPPLRLNPSIRYR